MHYNMATLVELSKPLIQTKVRRNGTQKPREISPLRGCQKNPCWF